ncbi:MAG: DUF6268 family outer membrane beta-barrel protein [Phycisphaerales bacterium]
MTFRRNVSRPGGSAIGVTAGQSTGVAAGLAAAFAVGLAAPALGQEGGPPSGVTGESESGGLSFTFNAAASTFLDADLGPGEVGRSFFDSGLAVTFSPSDRWRLTVDLSGSWGEYDFSRQTFAGAGTDDLVTDVYEAGIGLRALHFVSRDFGWVFGASVRSSGDPDIDFDDGLVGSGFVAARWQRSREFAWSLGVLVSSQLEDDVRVIPFIGVDWDINDRLSLNSSGPGARLGYEVSEDVTAFLGFNFDSGDYRLADDSPVAGGVLRDDRLAVELGLRFQPNAGTTIELAAGVLAYNDIEVLDADGIEVFQDEADPSAMFRLSLSVDF